MTQATALADATAARDALLRDPRRGTVAAADCYWAVLDARPLGRTRIAPAERGYLFEPFIPLPIEEVQAAYLPLADGRVVACGFERVRLDAMARDGLLSLSPDLVPDFVLREAGCAVDPMSFDFLSGDFEPVEVRRCVVGGLSPQRCCWRWLASSQRSASGGAATHTRAPPKRSTSGAPSFCAPPTAPREAAGVPIPGCRST